MKGGKAMGLDCIPIEVWRGLGDIVIVWLTKLFNLIFRSNKMPEEWRRSILVPIFKNKGDVQSCTNYHEIKLMIHTMNPWERVIEHRVRGMTRVTKNQFGFMPGRSTMEAIFWYDNLWRDTRSKRRTCIWCSLTWRRPPIRYCGMSCGRWKNTKSRQSTLPSLRICTTML